MKLSRENIDIYRLEGRFKGIRKTIYKVVAAVPLIGKKKKPFKALSCVSLNIGNGMFGLAWAQRGRQNNTHEDHLRDP